MRSRLALESARKIAEVRRYEELERAHREQLTRLAAMLAEVNGEEQGLIADERRARSELEQVRSRERGAVAAMSQAQALWILLRRKERTLLELTRAQEDEMERLLRQASLVQDRLSRLGTGGDSAGSWIWPVSYRRLTGLCGPRRAPARGASTMHLAIDIAAPRGARVVAARAGRVYYAGWLGGAGYAIILSHPGGFASLYYHLSSVSVRRGQAIRQGQLIGRVGSTGISTGPHLHFAVHRAGRALNPVSLLGR